MIYVTQLVYVHEGGEGTFQEFEEVALPLLARYRGELVLRFRLERSTQIGGSEDTPYEVHVVRVESEADLTAYSNDAERQRALPLKERSVRRAIIIKGVAEAT